MNDMRKLKLAILNQSIQDYIKLQHPKYRSKKYLEESFIYSVNMFFDPCYSFLYFFNEDGEHESTLEFIKSATETYVKDLEPMRDYLKKESVRYWKNKTMKTFKIPNYLVYNGIVYNLLMHNKKNFLIDYKSNQIFLNKKDENAESQFLYIFLEIVKKEHSIKLSKKDQKTLSEEIYSFLKMNKMYLD